MASADMSGEQVTRHLALAQRAFEQGATGTAEANFRCAVQLSPGHAEARFGLALALSKAEKHSESIEHLLESLSIQPNNPTGWILLSSLFQRSGNFEDAIQASKRASELAPTLSRPLVDITACRKVTDLDQPLIASLEAMANDQGRTAGERISIEYALGKARLDLKQAESAIWHFNTANKLGSQLVSPHERYRTEAESEAAEAVIQRFTPSFLEQFSGSGSDSELPVFIVGMIRSGTTLLDAMLASHPLIGSAGELRFWEERATGLLTRAYRGNLQSADIRQAADEFRRLLRSSSYASKRVIDKMPVNYQHVGLIRMAFPNARFIHCKRHPVDTCLSIFFTDFGPEPPRFAFSRPSIVHAYRTYQRFMEHWKCVVPADRIQEVNYSDLILNREETLHDLIQFLELEWNEDVLHHENSSAPIQTPSRWQARQPVYSSSLDRWKQFEPWLEEFSELL